MAPNPVFLDSTATTTSHIVRRELYTMSTFLAKLAPKSKPAKGKGASAASSAGRPRHMQIVATSYTSKPVKVAPNFLITMPYDAQPILTYRVDFAKTPLPEYQGSYAVVLDNVLSPSECKQLITYAEESTGAHSTGEVDKENAEEVENNGWKPALVNAGPGREILMTDYRNSDRIIWDNQEMMNRLWARCLLGHGIKDQLGRIERKPLMQGVNAANRGDRWHFSRLNERMRFLKYGPGQFFKGTCPLEPTTILGTDNVIDRALRRQLFDARERWR